MLALFIISAELVGAVSGFFTLSSIPTWYLTLHKPFFSPPNWLFGPVWVALYAIMGVAAYFIWRTKGKNKTGDQTWKTALRLYWLQLIFNFLWTIVFFSQRNIGAGLVDIIVLLALIVATTLTFFKIDKTAGRLFLPYLVWVSFATILNVSLFFLN